jgi:hypothetical protein
MTTEDLLNILKEELGDSLIGELKYTGDVIKYEYDAFLTDHDETDLEDICYADRTLIEDFLSNQEDFFTTEPETHDQIIYFYIEK